MSVCLSVCLSEMFVSDAWAVWTTISRRILFRRISAEKYSASWMLIHVQSPENPLQKVAKLTENSAPNLTTVAYILCAFWSMLYYYYYWLFPPKTVSLVASDQWDEPYFSHNFWVSRELADFLPFRINSANLNVSRNFVESIWILKNLAGGSSMVTCMCGLVV